MINQLVRTFIGQQYKKIMAKLNRLKAVLVEQDKTSKWLAEQVGKSACTVSKSLISAWKERYSSAYG